MQETTKFYKRWYVVANFLFHTFFRLKIVGRENITDGAAMICGNHSSMLDPIFIGVALGKNYKPLYIAKTELFKVPVLSQLITGLGAVPVDRTKADISIVKAALGSLKKGRKVIIFPEGTRVHEDHPDNAKTGAIKIAEKANATILPIYLPRKKPFFSKVRVVIGKPYKIPVQPEKRTPEDYTELTHDFMQKIFNLGLKSGR
jgi:1-acyl-sn-glycerol-3-phosphate acyltransferase